MVAVSDFSGLMSSICALASAVAMAPMVSLERCMTGLHVKQVKADGTGFGTLGAQAMADGLPGVFRHQFLQIGLGGFVFLVGRTGPAEGGGKLGPAVGSAHVADA